MWAEKSRQLCWVVSSKLITKSLKWSASHLTMFSYFNISQQNLHQNHLGSVSKQISELHFKSFWFSRSRLEPQILCLWQISMRCWCCWSVDHTWRSNALVNSFLHSSRWSFYTFSALLKTSPFPFLFSITAGVLLISTRIQKWSKVTYIHVYH